MTSQFLQSHLDTIDVHLNQVAACLLVPESGDLAQASLDLQAAVLTLAQSPELTSVNLQTNAVLKLRLRKTLAAFESCRETLMRRSAINQSSLATLMPATRSHTYGPAGGKTARLPYGSAGRQSGEFRVVSA